MLFLFHALIGAFVDVSRIFSCPADHVPNLRSRTLLGMVEARSIKNVKNRHTGADREKNVDKKGLVRELLTQIIWRIVKKQGGKYKALKA